jgi:hypothetical protein
MGIAFEIPRPGRPRYAIVAACDASGRLMEAYSARINVKNARVAVLGASD